MDKYLKFFLTLLLLWLFTFTFMLYDVIIQKIKLDKTYQIIKVDYVGMPLIRFNQQTGITEYWSIESGGWVEIRKTGLVTAVSSGEREKRKEIIGKWYSQLSDEVKKEIPKKTFESFFENSPSWKLEEEFNLYQENPEKWEQVDLEIMKLLRQ